MVKKPEQVILEAIDAEMDEIIDRVFQLSQETLVADKKIDTGNLLKNANINRSFLEKEIVYSAPYADSIEFGRTPGTMPPVDALLKWVRRKLGVQNEVQIRNTAFAIAQAIKQRGMQPSPFIRPAWEQTKREHKLEG